MHINLCKKENTQDMWSLLKITQRTSNASAFEANKVKWSVDASIEVRGRIAPAIASQVGGNWSFAVEFKAKQFLQCDGAMHNLLLNY